MSSLDSFSDSFDEFSWIRNWWENEGLADSCEHDVTTESLLNLLPNLRKRPVAFVLLAKKPGVFSGQIFLDWIQENQSEWKFEKLARDGDSLEAGSVFVSGKAELATLLARERMILNMLQHLSGIATATQQLVKTVAESWKFKIAAPSVLHTRKFLPGLRHWQAQACIHGGGSSHRLNLGDRILFKDNHKKFLRREGKTLVQYYADLQSRGLISDALIEVETIPEGLEAVQSGVRNILLDNFTPEEVKAFFGKISSSQELNIELSGNLNQATLPNLLVDPRIRRLSFGSISHSVKALDISLEILE